MRRQKNEITFVLGLAALIVFGVATVRNFGSSGKAEAATPVKKEANAAQTEEFNDGEVFSPSGTSRSAVVTPAPNQPPFKGVIGPTVEQSEAYWPDQPRAPKDAPNILFVMLDDVGFAQLGCYGAAGIDTPHIDKLAQNGLS